VLERNPPAGVLLVAPAAGLAPVPPSAVLAEVVAGLERRAPGPRTEAEAIAAALGRLLRLVVNAQAGRPARPRAPGLAARDLAQVLAPHLPTLIDADRAAFLTHVARCRCWERQLAAAVSGPLADADWMMPAVPSVRSSRKETALAALLGSLHETSNNTR
jgi:hypothetical protein